MGDGRSSSRTRRRCNTGCSVRSSIATTTCSSSGIPLKPSIRGLGQSRATWSSSVGSTPTPARSCWTRTSARLATWSLWATPSPPRLALGPIAGLPTPSACRRGCTPPTTRPAEARLRGLRDRPPAEHRPDCPRRPGGSACADEHPDRCTRVGAAGRQDPLPRARRQRAPGATRGARRGGLPATGP